MSQSPSRHISTRFGLRVFSKQCQHFIGYAITVPSHETFAFAWTITHLNKTGKQELLAKLSKNIKLSQQHLPRYSRWYADWSTEEQLFSLTGRPYSRCGRLFVPSEEPHAESFFSTVLSRQRSQMQRVTRHYQMLRLAAHCCLKSFSGTAAVIAMEWRETWTLWNGVPAGKWKRHGSQTAAIGDGSPQDTTWSIYARESSLMSSNISCKIVNN